MKGKILITKFKKRVFHFFFIDGPECERNSLFACMTLKLYDYFGLVKFISNFAFRF